MLFLGVFRCILLSIFFLVSTSLLAQESNDKLEFGDTGTTTKSPKYKSNKRDYKKKRPIQWVKNTAKDLLIGNPCMEEVTQEMGFVYLIQPKGASPNKNEVQRLLHNLFAKLAITFRNGPFWKFKLKKKRKECGMETGDIVG